MSSKTQSESHTPRPKSMIVYVESVIADQRCAELTPAQFGGYWRILLRMWMGGAAIEGSDRNLANAAGMQTEEWRQDGPVIRSMLMRYPGRDGYLTQKRLLQEYPKAVESVEKKRRAGIAAGRESARRRKLKQAPAATSDSTSGSTSAESLVQPSVQPSLSLSESLSDSFSESGHHSPSLRSGESARTHAPHDGWIRSEAYQRFEAKCISIAPNRVHPAFLERVYSELVSGPEDEQRVLRCLEAFQLSRDWQQEVFPRFENWLRQLAQTHYACPAPWNPAAARPKPEDEALAIVEARLALKGKL